jgi:hypothetical protein
MWRLVGSFGMRGISSWGLGVVVLVGCNTSVGGGHGTPSLEGNWLETNATEGLGLTFDANGDYVASVLALTSANSANAQEEVGTWTMNGSTLTLTPREWSCLGADPAYSYVYQFGGSDLELTSTSAALHILQPNTATVSTSFTLTIGCFGDNYTTFTAQPLAPVVAGDAGSDDAG